MTTTKDIIDAVIDAETPDDNPSAVTNDAVDGGGRTQFGISEKANPAAWADGKVTEDEARAIYEQKYVVGPGFHLIPDSHPIKAQLIDFGVNSGPAIAIQKLQVVLGVEVDGKLGPETLAALERADARIVNNHLMVERVKMIGRIVGKTPSQLKWLSGWQNRALEFLV